MAEFLASVSPDIPWHVTAFHKDYNMTSPENTNSQTLVRAAGIGKAAGLRFVYAGNIPGRTGDLENTYCPMCHELLIERLGFHILSYRLTPAGACPGCGTAIPGRWAPDFQGQIADIPFVPRSRRRSNPFISFPTEDLSAAFIPESCVASSGTFKLPFRAAMPG